MATPTQSPSRTRAAGKKPPLMEGGSEGHAGGNERRKGQPRRHETHCGRLTEEHDGAARSIQQRRAGSRFRYRRRRQAATYLRPAQDASFHVIFFAALWTALVGAGVLATTGTIAIGTDTDSDRILVRTAVEAVSPGSRFPSEHEASIYLSHSATLLDFITANSSSRRAYATPCYSRLRPTSTHANLQPQRTCFCPHTASPPFLVTNPSLPTARQFQPAPPITGNHPPERPDRTDSTRFTARMRPAAPTADHSNGPGRMDRTRSPLSRSAQRLHASKPGHPVHTVLLPVPSRNTRLLPLTSTSSPSRAPPSLLLIIVRPRKCW